jgi:hypothetical protein
MLNPDIYRIEFHGPTDVFAITGMHDHVTDFVIMQSTGRYAKGKEIFEGDIVG